MNKTILILSILAFIAGSCGQRTNKNTKTESNGDVSQTIIDDLKSAEISKTTTSDFKTFEFEFGFKVTVGKQLEYDEITYGFFKLERNNSIVYLDSLLEGYTFDDSLFPIILQTGENSFELLFEIDNRPSKNYLKRLFVSNDKLLGQDKLPTFEAKPTDINNDGTKEYGGFWHYSQIWGENDNLTAYNPILYYSITETGLKLDSLLTKQQNEIIYGQFYGFSFSEDNEQPISVNEKFGQELKMIRSER